MTNGPTRIALVEIGTNSTKLVVADAQADDTFRVRHASRRTTRIGRGLAAGGSVHPGAVDENIAAIKALKEIISRYRCDRVFAFSTFALRRAANAATVTRRLEGAIGEPLRIITGRDEARFAYLSAERHLRLTRPAAVLIDIGGGSTEVVVARHGRVSSTRSLPLGALHLTERFLHSDPVDSTEFAGLERHVDRVMRRAFHRSGIHRSEPRNLDLVASGGTIGAISWVIACSRREARSGPTSLPASIRLGEASAFLDRCLGLSLRERRRIPGLHPDRAEIVCAGLAIVLAAMRNLGKRTLQPSRGGVREGALIHIIRRGLRW